MPPSVENGSIALEDNDDTVRAIYTCNNGFQMSGADELICDLDTDEWDKNPPTCVKGDSQHLLRSTHHLLTHVSFSLL